MHLYKTIKGNILQHKEKYYLLPADWDFVINRDKLQAYLLVFMLTAETLDGGTAKTAIRDHLLPPIGSQELWAAGVTYLRSRDARMEESEDSGAADCYQRVYEAERPELFFKSLPHRVSGQGGTIHIRKDSIWNVPEPELVLYINAAGDIQAYTIGNDVSSRSIEGENPLYLPQAKVYERSAALGPGLYVPEGPIPADTAIDMKIFRGSELMYEGTTAIDRMKRSLTELAGWLYKETDFETGCFLMTGTCLIPANEFTLQVGDVVEIGISGIGKLRNVVAIK
ncbi:MAG TPA: fumarylacetoacetate hydrolase family protein [Chitinophagaceae bacterium]|jgi:2-dehydro-3-deoxy-D-arabinonate dehydratase